MVLQSRIQWEGKKRDPGMTSYDHDRLAGGGVKRREKIKRLITEAEQLWGKN